MRETCGRDKNTLSVVIHSALNQIISNETRRHRRRDGLNLLKATNTMDMESESRRMN